tara:strand:+ start:128293 stop:133821 length:5529 start_codon:yes stop_codon:yes gene_type:complete
MRLKFLFLLSLVFAFSCSQKHESSQIEVDPGFSSYISAYTSGVVSASGSIKIMLIEPKTDVKIGDRLEEGIFDFDPQVEGVAYWTSSQSIEFKPADRFKSGEVYKVSFDLAKIQEVPSEFEKLDFSFNVINQNLFVSFDGISNTDDEKIQYLKGTVRTSDETNNQSLIQCLSAKQNGKKLPIEWEHPESGKTHAFKVKNVARAVNESYVTLSWDGDAIQADVEGEKEIRIPPLGEFALVQVNTISSPGVYFSIQFSDKLNKNQNLDGLVYLKSGKGLRLSINDNEIKAYPTDELSTNESITIDRTITNHKGQQLQNTYVRNVHFTKEKPSLEILGTGVIMPSGKGVNFPFKAINLKAVNLRIVRIFEKNVPQFLQQNQLNGKSNLTRVGRIVYDGTLDLVASEAIDYGQWNNFSVDISNLIDAEPGAIYRVMMSFERYQSLYPCAGDEALEKPFKRRDNNFDDGDGYFNEYYSWFEEDYSWNDRSNPCKTGYYMNSDHFISANVLASDFGLIAKEAAGNKYNVVVTDLRSAEALRGVDIEVHDYQNNIIAKGKTNGDGVVQLDAEHKGYLIVATKGKHKGYLRVDNGSALEVSLYEIGGKKIEKGVKGFLYGERGVWRPGDTIHLSFMLEDKENTLPENHPVVVELFDPQGKLYDKKVSTVGVEGLYAFALKTNSKDKTGQWQVKATVGNSTFHKSLKIETVKPNRINIELNNEPILSSTKKVHKELTAMWLYGAPGANLKVSSELELTNLKTTFDKFKGYQFDDRSKSFYQNNLKLAEGKTNAEGKATLNFNVEEPNNAPGMLKVNFRTKVFEQGGDFSQDFQSAKYSPYRSYVGVKLPASNNWLNALNTKEKHAINIAAVDEFGKPQTKEVTIELYRMRWSWWWEGSGESELSRYINRQSSNLIKTDNFTVENGKSVYNLSFPIPGWGQYLIRVIDKESGHSTSQSFYGRYPGWYSNGNDEGSDAATMLNVTLDKDDYLVGETAEIRVPSGGIGNVYISIEKGDKILKQFWAKADKNNTVIQLPITEEMAPNVYASVFLLQPHAQKENSLPIRMYGIAPIRVTNPKTKLTPELKAPVAIRPESEYKVTVSEKEGKAMAYTLAVVDEGLLSLTRFKTPNPWDAFYAKEALLVNSWDMYKYVMSAETGKMAAMLSIGGDEALSFKEDAEANRFKPVVRFIGPFYLKANESATHKLHMPNYIGAVRVMAVAGLDGAYGSAQKEIKVKQPLMVLTTLPRVLGPSEKMRIPINVISTDDRIKNATVKVSSNNLLKNKDSESKSVVFDGVGDQTIFFDFEVARQLGVAKFKVEVTSGKETAFEEIEILVRPPNPEISKSNTVNLEAGKNWSADYKAVGIKGTNKNSLTISKLPDLDLEKHLQYLIRYPHGCIEQTTSSVFPQLYLGSLTQLSATQKESVDNNITAALNRYRQFQTTSGGFTYWPGNGSYPSEWGTNYAGHFMVEAKLKGYTLPSGMLDSWIKYQKQTTSKWSRDNYNEYGRRGADLNQAYRLYTLALAGSPDLGAMNRLKNDAKLSNAASWRLCAAYAIVGRKDVAEEMSKRSLVVESYREMAYTYGSTVRDMAMILETLNYLKDSKRGVDMVNDICVELNKGWHSTQTRSYALLAIAKFIGVGDFKKTFEFEAIINGKTHKVNSNEAIYTFEIDKSAELSGTISVVNSSDQMLFVSLSQSGVPLESEHVNVEDDLKMQIVYRDMKGNPISVESLKQGTDFKALVTISHPGTRSAYQEMALNQIFPSGWQIVNTRVGDAGDELVSSTDFKYQDIRDDRVYTYFDLSRGKSKTFEILLNATFAGKFYQPAVFCAPMYDESIQAAKPGRWVEVVASEK